MKDGTTHLAYKAENVVDTESNLIVGAQIGSATASDAVTLVDSLHAAQAHLENAGLSDAIKDVTADKGYPTTQTLTAITEHTDYKTYIPEPKQPKGRRRNLRERTLKERRALLNIANVRRAARDENSSDFAVGRWNAALLILWKVAAACQHGSEVLRKIKSGTSSCQRRTILV